MKHAKKTRPFLGLSGAPLPNSIAEVRYIRLGGLDQWVMIRGENLDNPPMILLHGGPGFSETPFFRRYNAPLEKGLTVVYWDQRGAGKSADPKITKSAMTVERFVADLDELVGAVCARVGQPKVVISGHSWGSVLGPLYATRFPEKVAAYVGCGQIGDWQSGVMASYKWALEQAQRIGSTQALKELRTIGLPPHTAIDLWKERIGLQRFAGQKKVKALWTMLRTLFGAPESSVFDVFHFPSILRALRFSLDAMWAEVSVLKLQALAPELQMPVYFFLGRNDRWVPPEVSVAYVDMLTAPSKNLVWFEDSGHEPFVDEPAKFNRLMLDLVRSTVAVLA